MSIKLSGNGVEKTRLYSKNFLQIMEHEKQLQFEKLKPAFDALDKL